MKVHHSIVTCSDLTWMSWQVQKQNNCFVNSLKVGSSQFASKMVQSFLSFVNRCRVTEIYRLMSFDIVQDITNHHMPSNRSWSELSGLLVIKYVQQSHQPKNPSKSENVCGFPQDGILLRTLTAAVGPERRRLLVQEFEEQWTSGQPKKGVEKDVQYANCKSLSLNRHEVYTECMLNILECRDTWMYYNDYIGLYY